MKARYEVYETNAGQLVMLIWNAQRELQAAIENWEYAGRGILREATDALNKHPGEWKYWQLVDPELLEDYAHLAEADERDCTLIADQNGVYAEHMGAAGRLAFDINDEFAAADSDGIYRYYTLSRPPMPGGVPSGAKAVWAWDARTFVPEISRYAWGMAEYSRPLTLTEMSDYELIPKSERR